MAMAILNVAYKSRDSTRDWETLLQAAHERLGHRAETVLASLEERSRDRLLIDQRRDVRDPDLRFFLALLLNLPNRNAIYHAIGQRCPDDDPEEYVVRWIGDQRFARDACELMFQPRFERQHQRLALVLAHGTAFVGAQAADRLLDRVELGNAF
jgi:hypothetical protein